MIYISICRMKNYFLSNVLPLGELKYEVTDQLISRGASINPQAARGYTPLDRSVFQAVMGGIGKAAMCRLVQAGAYLWPNSDPKCVLTCYTANYPRFPFGVAMSKQKQKLFFYYVQNICKVVHPVGPHYDP